MLPLDGKALHAAVLATDRAIDTLRAENERLEREVASLAADLAVFTTEPGVLARVGFDHTTYWYNQTRLRDAENERLRRAMSKVDGLAKTAYGCLTDAQPAEGDDDISAAMDALDRIRDVLDLPTPEAWDPRNRGIPEFQPAAPARFFVQSCGCIDPQPDPASPCGWVDSVDGKACGATGDAQCHEPPCWPPYVPTLCATCHHAIEVTP